MLELCQVRGSLAGGASEEMVTVFNKLRETYRISVDRDQNLDEVSLTKRQRCILFWKFWHMFVLDQSM